MKQTLHNREDLLISDLPSPLCPGSECNGQSRHLLLQLSVRSSPWGAEVSEPCGYCIIVSCLLSVCTVPRSRFYPCQVQSNYVDKITESLGPQAFCFAQRWLSVSVRHMQPGIYGTWVSLVNLRYRNEVLPYSFGCFHLYLRTSSCAKKFRSVLSVQHFSELMWDCTEGPELESYRESLKSTGAGELLSLK